MATISITVPDAVQTRVVDAICARKGYVAGQGQTKAQFVKAQIALFIKNEVKSYEAEQAAKTAFETAQTAAETDLAIT